MFSASAVRIAAIACAVGLPTVASVRAAAAEPGLGSGARVLLAQLQPKDSKEEQDRAKRKQHEEHGRPPGKQGPAPGQPNSQQGGPMHKGPGPKQGQMPPQDGQHPGQFTPKQEMRKGIPPRQVQTPPQNGQPSGPGEQKKDLHKQFIPKQVQTPPHGNQQPPQGNANQQKQNGPAFGASKPGFAPNSTGQPGGGAKNASSNQPGDHSRFHRIEDLQKGRHQRVEDGGKRTVIEEPDKRIIVKQQGGRSFIHHDEGERLRLVAKNARTERRSDGTTVTIISRPSGQVFSVLDGHGRLIRRYRRGRDGREVVLIDNSRHFGPGRVAVVAGLAALAIAAPVITIARSKYIVDYRDASEDDVYEALSAPPVERLERTYSLEEVRENQYLRDRMRRVDLDVINFESGSWEITPDQFPRLEWVAHAMKRVLDRNPDEVFLIEGHTDAVGSDVDNLTLSDRRAEAVAIILSETFGIPPENLVTQGYGEQFLKVPTQGDERLNRRVAVRRITPLMSRSGF